MSKDKDLNELVQLNVRLSSRRVEIAKKIAKLHGESLQAYFDRLIGEDAMRERDVLLKSYDDDLIEIRQLREATLRDLGQL